MEKNSIHHSLSLHELLAHTHLLTERQRRMGSIGPVGPLLCVHAEGMRDGQPVAVDRFFAGDCSPRAALLAMRNYGPARDNLLFVVDAPPERQRAFVRAGFRLQEVQWLMACTLAEWQPLELPRPDLAVHSATQASDALLLNTIEGLEPVPIGELRDPALMHYYCTVHDKPIAYARGAAYDESIHWVSHVYTAPPFRRQGCAQALMTRLLSESARLGAGQILLLSTEMAHNLYLRLGFTDVAPVALLSLSQTRLRRR
ncbi:MAG: GNAT family N-acetyltransferase [Caldilineaceae bacterium]